jgi:hypothetical protein
MDLDFRNKNMFGGNFENSVVPHNKEEGYVFVIGA